MTANATVVRLESKNYHEKLFEKFFHDDFVDVVLWAEGKSISAHRCVLAAGSTVFHQMLKVCNSHDKLPVLVLNDMTFEHLRRLIEYMYCGKTKLNASELDEFFLAAKRYRVLGLNDAETSNANEMSEASVPCSVVFEFVSGEDGGEASDDDKDTQNGSGQYGLNRNKRKSDENESDSSSQVPSRKSILNKSKRACPWAGAPPQQPTNGNDSQQTPIVVKPPANRSPTMVKTTKATTTKATAKPTTSTHVAGPNETTKGSPHSNGKATNDPTDDNVKAQDDSARASNGSAGSTNERYKCQAIGCGKVFATSQNLVRHRKFKCAQCKTFKCSRCHESFGLQIILNRHTCLGRLGSGSAATASKSALH